MQQRPFKQVDVFTASPYRGNPLAVVLDGSDLDADTMQHFTNWTNLSECTFLLPPTPEGAAAGADYRVRIFCPGRELPFAGHPTLGSCHAWLEQGGLPKQSDVVQECGAGLIRIRRGGNRLAFAAPPRLRIGPLDEADVALIARGLGVARDDIVAHSWCDNGPNWRGVMLKSAEQVLALKPDSAVLAGLDIGVIGPRGKVGVIGSSAAGEAQFEVRAFFPGNAGMAEDPVTGSLNAALAQWLIGAGLAPEHYVASQGTALQREGRVHITRDADGSVWVGGSSVTCIDGTIQL
ncbi:phenazine biosynthesis protein PhzF [Hydrogenophaga crassostreae]|uniref:Phenazine biosynthesis protein PhzF n=1 Tax=Hydrogenophaga crassostreae TaxID=1763535 RepID=A0A170AHB5_9BURK|nr:PhzF family phenazine biosynthesis protein [Hydrogenophaga crassostreae]AOW15309.1 phenazine biosynthesis protein PhzF [Hydrogenophaga crassostreae]OAD43928.1 phenazine biosynthesis protein PhzF [Hydrogenophaga crassostreae]